MQCIPHILVYVELFDVQSEYLIYRIKTYIFPLFYVCVTCNCRLIRIVRYREWTQTKHEQLGSNFVSDFSRTLFRVRMIREGSQNWV